VRERQWFQTYLASSERLTHGRRNAVAKWLDELGVFGLRSYEKRVPVRVFSQPAPAIGVFLRHLWATDGCIHARSGRDYPVVRYDSSSGALARDVQSLLLRVGVNAVRRVASMGSKGRPLHRVMVMGRGDLERFLAQVGGLGAQRSREHGALLRRLDRQRARNTNRDVVPRAAWDTLVKPALAASGMTTRDMQESIGMHYNGTRLYAANLGRERAARVAKAVGSRELERLASSDVYWDDIIEIEPAGNEDVFDLTVDGLHNFVAADITVHNSIEQDSDLVLFIYRDEYYNEESDQQGIAELNVAKHRNGPTGSIKLSFLKRYAKFSDLAA
jgi:replicative DNA helicase